MLTLSAVLQLVEVKSGETYNGTLVVCDAWMNILLRNVVRTNKTGDKFWQLPELYIRGSRIKYICVPDDVIDLVPRDADAKAYRPPTGDRGRYATIVLFMFLFLLC